jgi:hypothetical protein
MRVGTMSMIRHGEVDVICVVKGVTETPKFSV